MVVLESHHTHHHHTHHHNMGSTGGHNHHNQYLQPDHLSSTSTMLDSKKSPLAMLVATCSQIGADPCHPASATTTTPSSTKFINVSSSTKKASSTPPNEPNNNHHSSSKRTSPPIITKPSYNTTPLSITTTPTNKSSSSPPAPTKPSPPENNHPVGGTDQSKKGHKRPRSSSSITSASTISPIPPKSSRTTTTTTTTVTPPLVVVPSSQPQPDHTSPTPTIRSGMEVLQGGHRYPPTMNIPHPSSPGYYYPAMMDPSSAMFLLNPAFRDLRLPFPSPSPYNTAPSVGSPYLSSPYYRPTTKGECKDPYCTGCPPSSQNVLLCPAGCASCDHQKVPYPPQFYHTQPPTHSPNGGGGGTGISPHICNWIVGDNYCGKRFPSSEELLQHLRSHTSAAAAAENSASALALQQHLAASSLYNHPAFFQQMGLGMNNPGMAAAALMQQQLRGQLFPQFSPYHGGPKHGGSGAFNLPPGYYPPPSNPYASLFPSRPV